MPDEIQPGSAFHAMVIDRSARGLSTAKAFEAQFSGMVQSMSEWHQTGFEFLIFGAIPANGESVMVWARDLEELACKAVPALMLSLADRRLVPHFTVVVSKTIEPQVAALLQPRSH